MPEVPEKAEPEIFNDPLDMLRRSSAYPYGLSDWMIDRLHGAGINSVRDLYEAPDQALDNMPYVGEYRIRQLRDAVAQAIWL
jgi:hypothetical protein